MATPLQTGLLLPAALAGLARQRPEAPLYTCVDERGRVSGELTTRQTLDDARATARGLREHAQLRRGSRVLVVDRPGMEVIQALLGAMHAGLVPVPLPVPVMGASASGGANLTQFARDCGAVACLTSQSFAGTAGFAPLRAQMAQAGVDLPWHTTETLREEGAQRTATSWSPFEPTRDDLALIQYTSGSTRRPRGVCVTYGNLDHQLAYQRFMLRGSPDSRYMFWLPHYHDFALIAAIMGAAHGGGRLILASPSTFLRRPAAWGDLLHQFRATHTAAPDFGYRVFVERTTPEERARWDLSCLEVVSCAAEPIRASTVDSLLRAFAPSGMNPAAFNPCYGLAEHTVGVTMGGQRRLRFSRRALEVSGRAVVASGPDAVEFFGCGKPQFGVEVRIVDPATQRALEPGAVGEIWVQSPSVCAGYFGQEEETREVFQAKLADDSGQWLRTGDLGTLVEGELFITGRLKELIILQGRNVYPQDIEAVAELAHPLIRTGAVVAFGVDDGLGAEALVVLVELQPQSPTDPELDQARRAVRSALQAELGVGALTLAFARRGSIQRTTSGKLMRGAARNAWKENQLTLLQVDRGLASAPQRSSSHPPEVRS